SFRLITREGDERTVQLSSSRIDWDGKPATLNFVRDISDHKRLEKVLHQAQKMEAIGTLAGGIAHDFNNILMGVLGRISLMKVKTGRASSESEHLQAMEEYIQSAVGLTRQLLGVARGGKYEPKPVEIGELIADSAQMFGRTRKELSLHVDTVAGPLVCEVDSRQIEQVLLNMYVNAWQAMGEGGELHLRTSAETLQNATCRLHQVEPGRYAKISITDSGCGMDETTLQRIFDPFFTTKEKSRGTGLGLASAYGIIKNHKGFITVYSEPDHGATFTIYLPLSERRPLSGGVVEEVVFRGEGHILVVDDEQMITEVGRSMLNQLGYSVSTAGSGREALALLEAQGERIDMVLLDLIMPGMDGGAVFDAIRRLHPAMPVILSSGYSLNGYATEIMVRGCSGFIQKPFNLAELSRKIHEVIDDARSQDGETKRP
ncbi:MAG TPA: response regulator, partial [Desulfopila sp.]|nr:response regulator [Desulfopila sp.]